MTTTNNIGTMISSLTKSQQQEFAVRCARRVQHLMRDPRSIAVLDTRERWLAGSATDEEMRKAARAARASADAAWASARAASADVARAAARAASADVARAAAWDAAWASADAAARAAADAAYNAERAAQREELERMLKEGGVA